MVCVCFSLSEALSEPWILQTDVFSDPIWRVNDKHLIFSIFQFNTWWQILYIIRNAHLQWISCWVKLKCGSVLNVQFSTNLVFMIWFPKLGMWVVVVQSNLYFMEKMAKHRSTEKSGLLPLLSIFYIASNFLDWDITTTRSLLPYQIENATFPLGQRCSFLVAGWYPEWNCNAVECERLLLRDVK